MPCQSLVIVLAAKTRQDKTTAVDENIAWMKKPGGRFDFRPPSTGGTTGLLYYESMLCYAGHVTIFKTDSFATFTAFPRLQHNDDRYWLRQYQNWIRKRGIYIRVAGTKDGTMVAMSCQHWRLTAEWIRIQFGELNFIRDVRTVPIWVLLTDLPVSIGVKSSLRRHERHERMAGCILLLPILSTNPIVALTCRYSSKVCCGELCWKRDHFADPQSPRPSPGRRSNTISLE